MQNEEYAQLLEVIALSIESEPAQFQIELNITGVNNSGQMTVSAVGGGPGSNTTGLHVSTPTDIAIANKSNQANEELSRQMGSVVTTLRALANEVRSSVPDKEKAKGFLVSLKQDWVPSLVTNIAATIATKSMGL